MPRDPLLDQSVAAAGPQLPRLQEGQRLFNRRYELVRLLGAGGMGVVWLARDHTEEIDDVALKFLPTIVALQPAEMKRLRAEVQAGKKLRHPRLVATYSLEVEDGVVAIIMEHVEGQTLKEKLEAHERGFFEPDEIAGWVRDVCDALHYLHEEAKIIHRDLKPANIIIDASGCARLMDFGISQRIQESAARHSKTSEGQADSGSTLAYASPQQLSGKPADKSDDIYSLGATLYDLLTGTPPFFRGGAAAVAHQIKTEPVTPILERRAELVSERVNADAGLPMPAAWERAVLSCLAKIREERPDSANELRQMLGTPASAPKSPAGADQSLQPPPRPHRLKPMSTLLAAGALLVGALGIWAFVLKPKEFTSKPIMLSPMSSDAASMPTKLPDKPIEHPLSPDRVRRPAVVPLTTDIQFQGNLKTSISVASAKAASRKPAALKLSAGFAFGLEEWLVNLPDTKMAGRLQARLDEAEYFVNAAIVSGIESLSVFHFSVDQADGTTSLVLRVEGNTDSISSFVKMLEGKSYFDPINYSNCHIEKVQLFDFAQRVMWAFPINSSQPLSTTITQRTDTGASRVGGLEIELAVW